jgi:hypothetical protein
MDDTRREFLKAGAKMAAVAAVPETLHGLSARVIGANDRVRVGIVGLRGRGENHITAFGALPNVEIAALCDIDDNVMSERLAQVRKMGFQPKTYVDIRKLLEDQSIDAVSIATPHHWHAVMAVWTMQAGKDEASLAQPLGRSTVDPRRGKVQPYSAARNPIAIESIND